MPSTQFSNIVLFKYDVAFVRVMPYICYRQKLLIMKNIYIYLLVIFLPLLNLGSVSKNKKLKGEIPFPVHSVHGEIVPGKYSIRQIVPVSHGPYWMVLHPKNIDCVMALAEYNGNNKYRILTPFERAVKLPETTTEKLVLLIMSKHDNVVDGNYTIHIYWVLTVP